MNLRSKRCLFNLLAWTSMVGAASAQSPSSEGVVRLGQVSSGQLPPPITSMDSYTGQMDLGGSYSGSGNVGSGYANVDRRFWPKANIDTRGGGLYGYNPGYTNIGVFMPFAIEGDEAIVWVDARGMVTHDGNGGANVGAGWRWWMTDVDRVVGLSAWYDNDSANRHVYNQIGLSAESLGRYVDYRVNGYIPVGTRANVMSSTVDPTDVSFQGNGLFFLRTSVAEQTYTGFDAELGGPLPIVGRYGVNGYIGGYHFMGNGPQGGSFTGVSGRFMAQINEDLQFGVQVTDDHTFGTNAQLQIFVTIPDGMPSKWLRNPTVQDRLTQSVYRQYRVMAHTDEYYSYDRAINPKDGTPYFVAHIDPNVTSGNGTAASPFGSISEYLAQPVVAQRNNDIVYVRPRLDNTSTNLDTAPTFTVHDGQRLLSTSVAQTFTAANFPGQALNLPVPTGFAVGDPLPRLINSAGGDIITLASNNVQCLEVSGFELIGSGGGGNGISGVNNSFVLLNNNNIHGAFNGLNLVGLTNGISPSVITNNTLHDNLNDGFHLLNIGGTSVSNLQLTNNLAYGNADDGFDLAADAGSTVGGLIDGNSTLPPAGGSANGDAGLSLSSVGGVLAFNNAPDQQISNNNFSSNSGDGVLVDVTLGGNADLLFVGNTISNNNGNGLYVPASDASLINVVFGGPDAADLNTVTGNVGAGLFFDLSNTANGVTAHIENNLIDGNRDGILVNLADNSVFGPAVGANTTEIFNNTISNNTRDGIRLVRNDSSTLDLGSPGAEPIHNNLIQGNAGDGLALITNGTAAPEVFLATFENVFEANGSDGLSITTNEDSVVTFDSNRDTFSENGEHGLNLVSNDSSTLNVGTPGFGLVNVVAADNVLDGLHSEANGNSLQNISITSSPDVVFTGVSTFSGNDRHGINTSATQTGKVEIVIDGIASISNGVDGWNLNRLDASLITATAANSTFNDNGSDGIEFVYTGSPPGDPNQQMSGTPNTLTLNSIQANQNGESGLRVTGAGDAILLANVTSAEFNGNGADGILINTELASSFGISPANRSVFDNVSIQGNGGDGIRVEENANGTTASSVFLEVNSNSGDTSISDNVGDGVEIVSAALVTDILIHSTNGNQTSIAGNGANGVRWDITNTLLNDSHQLTLDGLLIDSNVGDGVQFNVPVGSGLLTLTDNELTNNLDDGLNINVTAIGNLNGASIGSADIVATGNVIDGNQNHGVNVQLQSGRVDLSMTGGGQITNNGLNGVNIELRGASASRFNPNSFVFDDNIIASNGTRGVANQAHGFFFQEDAGEQGHRLVAIQTPVPTPDIPFDAFIPAFAPGIFNYNTGDSANTLFLLSRYMDLNSAMNATLSLTNNVIEFNGPSLGAPGDGVFLRVSTNSYLSADVSGNTLTGNGASDFRTESFVTGSNPPPSTAAAAPAADIVSLDHTAQLDLRLSGNTGNGINMAPGPGATFATGDPRKMGGAPRVVQLFQVDNSAGGLATNNFLPGLTVADQQNLFFNANYSLSTTPFSLNNFNFPRTYNLSPDNPFLP